MTTPAELKAAEAELADIIAEYSAVGFLIAFARRLPSDSEDIVRHFFRRIGVMEESIDSKVKAIYTLARAPRLAA